MKIRAKQYRVKPDGKEVWLDIRLDLEERRWRRTFRGAVEVLAASPRLPDVSDIEIYAVPSAKECRTKDGVVIAKYKNNGLEFTPRAHSLWHTDQLNAAKILLAP